MAKSIKQIKKFLDLKEVSDFTYTGKNGKIFKVNESRGKLESQKSAGSVFTIPTYQIRVSVDHGDDLTGEMGNFEKPFKTINAAATLARSEITLDPLLKNKILIVVESGEYLDETDIMFNGWIHCEPGVIIKTPETTVAALLLTHENGETFKLTGFPDIIEPVAGNRIWHDPSLLIALSIYLEINNLVNLTTTTTLLAEEIEMYVNNWDYSGFFQGFGYVNLILRVGNYIPPNIGGYKFITAINSVLPYNADINVDYLDQVTRYSNIGAFVFNTIIGLGFPAGAGFSNDYDTETRLHIHAGDFDPVNAFPAGRSIIGCGDTSTYTSTNKIYFSADNVTCNGIFSSSTSIWGVQTRDTIISGTFNCYSMPFFNNYTSLALTVNNLTVNCLNNDQVLNVYNELTQTFDLDVIGSLTMITTASPKVPVTSTISYISDYPLGGGVINKFDVEQIAHGFSVGDILSINDNGLYELADENAMKKAFGYVVFVADVDNFTVQLGGIIETTATYEINGDYYLGELGQPTLLYPYNAQYLFKAIDTNKILLDIGDMFSTGKIIADKQYIYDTLLITEPPIPPPLSGLLGLWELDETSGTTAVDAVNSQNGTINGGININQPGIINKAYEFQVETNQSVEFASTAFLLNSTALTISTWIYPYDTTTGGGGSYSKTVLSSWYNVDKMFLLRIRDTSIDFYLHTDTGGEVGGTFGNLNNNTKYHLLCEWDGSTMRMWINNVLSPNTYTISGNLGQNNAWMWWIGAYKTTFPITDIYNFDGLIDQTAFWNRTLTQTEKNYIYKYGYGRPFVEWI